MKKMLAKENRCRSRAFNPGDAGVRVLAVPHRRVCGLSRPADRRLENGWENVGPTLLVPLDFTRASAETFAFALLLARIGNASMVLLHVIEKGYAEAFLDTQSKWNRRTEAHRRAQAKLEEFARAGASRLVPIRCVVRHGLPEYEILRLAEELDVDLIVLGRRRRNPLTNLIFGSVARGIVDAAPCPVVVVPASQRQPRVPRFGMEDRCLSSV